MLLRLWGDVVWLFEFSFLISFPSCTIIMLRFFRHSQLSSLNYFFGKLEPEDSLLFSGRWFLWCFSVLLSLLWFEDCSKSVGLLLDMLMMLISDRFLLFAFERERSYPKLFFIFLFQVLLPNPISSVSVYFLPLEYRNYLLKLSIDFVMSSSKFAQVLWQLFYY